MTNRATEGVTLIELMVVMVILGTLFIGGFGAYSTVLRTSRDTKRQSDLEKIRVALELYKKQNDIYPNANGSTEIGLKKALTSPIPYITEADFPKDDSDKHHYFYDRTGTTTYRLCAFLEDTTNPAIASMPCPSGAGTPICGSGDSCNYGITQP